MAIKNAWISQLCNKPSRKSIVIIFVIAMIVAFQVLVVSSILVRKNSHSEVSRSVVKNVFPPVFGDEDDRRINTTAGVKITRDLPIPIEKYGKKTEEITNNNRTRLSKRKRSAMNSTSTSSPLDYRILHEFYPPVNFSVVFPHVTPKIDDKDIFLIILINSATRRNPNRERRKSIRKTWANKEQSRTPSHSAFVNHGFPFKTVLSRNFKLIFLLGRSGDQILDAENEQEAIEHNDIVIGNFKDTYTNLVVKVFMGFKWAQSLNCKYVLKGDDDTYVYLPRLMGILERVPDPFFGGYVVNNGHVFREPDNKHAISKMYYKDPYYPPYCEGAFYVFSFSLIPDFLRLTRKFRPFHVEDAYLGVLLKDIGVRPHYMPGFHLSSWMIGSIYHFNPCEWATIIALGHKFNTSHIDYIHKQIPLYKPSKLTAQEWRACGQQPMSSNAVDVLLPLLYGVLIALALVLVCVVLAFLPSYHNEMNNVHLRQRQHNNYYPYIHRAI